MYVDSDLVSQRDLYKPCQTMSETFENVCLWFFFIRHQWLINYGFLLSKCSMLILFSGFLNMEPASEGPGGRQTRGTRARSWRASGAASASPPLSARRRRGVASAAAESMAQVDGVACRTEQGARAAPKDTIEY